MIEVKGLAAFDSTIQDWFREVEQAAAEAAVGLAREAFEEILAEGPQFSGDFIGNTRVEVGKITPTFTPDLFPGAISNPFQRGDTPAMAYARANATWSSIRLGQSIYIHSTAKHDDYYSWKIESGQIALRDANSGADRVYSRAFSTTQFKFEKIGPVQLDWLRKVGT